MVKILKYLKRLGRPQKLWPKEMEIRNIAGKTAGKQSEAEGSDLS